jgi:hypothetical protein
VAPGGGIPLRDLGFIDLTKRTQFGAKRLRVCELRERSQLGLVRHASGVARLEGSGRRVGMEMAVGKGKIFFEREAQAANRHGSSLIRKPSATYEHESNTTCATGRAWQTGNTAALP